METLVHFNEFVTEITATTSRRAKQEILWRYRGDDIIQQYLKIAFDPYKVYGISNKKLNRALGDVYRPPVYTIFEFFDLLSQHNTGPDWAIGLCQDVIAGVTSHRPELETVLRSLICKNLSIGCDAKTINLVMPNLIPTFDIQLAQKYFDKPEKLEGKTFALTTKIDGGRIIAIRGADSVAFFTRAGQRYEGLIDLEKEMLNTFPEGTVLDGEITILENTGIPSKEAYKQAMKITRSDGEKHGLKMLVFDLLTLEEWVTQTCERSWEERRAFLHLLFQFGGVRTYFELLPVLYQGSDTSKVLEYLDKALANKEEGVMINICDAPYEFKRTWNLMKVKKMNTLDLQIVDFEEGSGRLAGTLGAIHVRYKNGNIVRVGSGFSDDLRDQIWENQTHYSGKIVEIQYFEETTNADGGISLRFPVFKDFRPDKLTPDF
jgi:DNA ligase-1